MCYSAMAEQSYQEYCRMMGGRGQADFVQIERTFRQRLVSPKFFKIARGFEANFYSPQTDVERTIKSLIDFHREMVASELEPELFKQKQRLAEATRAIAAAAAANKVPTKKAMKDQQVATDKIGDFTRRLLGLHRTETEEDDKQIFPRNFVPILIKDDGEYKVKLARYLLRRRGSLSSFDEQFKGCYNARRDNIDKFWKPEFGKTHALMMVDSFYENVENPDGSNKVLHFTPASHRPMLIACLYSHWGEVGSGDEFLSFAAVTDEPPPEVRAAGHDRCIVNLELDAVDDWLSPQGKSNAQLQQILDRRDRPIYDHQEVLAA